MCLLFCATLRHVVTPGWRCPGPLRRLPGSPGSVARSGPAKAGRCGPASPAPNSRRNHATARGSHRSRASLPKSVAKKPGRQRLSRLSLPLIPEPSAPPPAPAAGPTAALRPSPPPRPRLTAPSHCVKTPALDASPRGSRTPHSHPPPRDGRTDPYVDTHRPRRLDPG